MRLSDWRRKAPHRESMSAKVLALVEPVLDAMGADADPECWVAWGDDPSVRYTVLVPTDAGLIVAHVRVSHVGEGPRATAKVVRWPRVQLGELAVETQGGRRLLSFQVEGQILRGVDAEADQVSGFALGLLAAADGRTVTPRSRSKRRSAGRAASAKGRSARSTARVAPPKSAAKPAPGTRPGRSSG